MIYVDATGRGHLGVVVYADGVQSVYSSHCTGWMKVSDIYDLEMCANLGGLAVAEEYHPGRAIIMRSDNRGATQTLIRGARHSQFSRMTCDAFGI